MSTTTTIPWQARLKKGSAYFRVFLLIALISYAAITILGLGLNLTGASPQISWLSCWRNLTGSLKCWFAFSLLAYYARGEWFAPQSIRWMQALGALSVFCGLVNISYQILLTWQNPNFINRGNLHLHLEVGQFYSIPRLPLPMQLLVDTQYFVSLLFQNLTFGCLFLLTAWILNEARKLREEQDLTV
jgi:hypothetical protein